MPQGTGLIGHLDAGLRATSLRQTTIANNIANMATPGYRRVTLPFEGIFADALKSGRPVDLDDVASCIVQPRTDPLNEHGNDVELDAEVAELVRNSALYKTYMRVLNRMYRQMDLAIQG